MTVRQFNHQYIPSHQGTSGLATIELTTTEIAEAAIREIVQISLSSAPFDLFVEQLLVPNDQWFKWIGPLGQIRETKTALSGLFGRFVARAYLTRYFSFNYFEPIRTDIGPLAGWPQFTFERVRSGDLPDWVVASAAGGNSLALAEAKGSHNIAGPWAARRAARDQLQRIAVLSGNTQLQVKGYAVATRWAVQGNPRLNLPWLVVEDPDEGKRPPTPVERRQLARSIALGHFGALAEGLGFKGTAEALRNAKAAKPGSLRLPEHEQVNVQRQEKPTVSSIGAAITPNGIIPLPLEGDMEEYRQAILTLYGARSMFFMVDTEILRAIDSHKFLSQAASTFEKIDKESFWSVERSYVDGTLLVPLSATRMQRPTIPLRGQ